MPEPGTRSDSRGLPFDPPAAHSGLRITSVYATPWRIPPGLTRRGRSPGEALRLGRLAGFYATSDDQVPHVLERHDLDPSALRFNRWHHAVDAARCWLFTLPSGQVIACLTLDVPAGAVESIPLLEDLYYLDAHLDGTALEEWWCSRAGDVAGCETNGGAAFLPERHQLLFMGAPDVDSIPSQDQLQRVIYRADLPSRPESTAIRTPAELNRRPTTVGALGPYVSVIAGHQDYIENSALLSAVHIVGSAARLREIRQRAYECVGAFRAHRDDTLPARDRRVIFEDIADLLGELELELSFSVEATADIGLLVPALRVESYHDALYESMNLARRTETTSHMLDRLRNAIGAELTSVTSVEDRTEDARRVRTVVAVTFVSTVAGTLAILFGFFGVNAAEVDQGASMFDGRYLPIYLLILMIVSTGFALYVLLAWRERQARSQERPRGRGWGVTPAGFPSLDA